MTIQNMFYKSRQSTSILIQPILFILKLLIVAKRNYWPTKLEITAFIQVIQKLSLLVKSIHINVIIQMHYITFLNIMQQFSIISTSFTIKINIHLIRAFLFFRQFYLVVWHKFGKKHIILDALGRLAGINNIGYNSLYLELNALFMYHTTLIIINLQFVQQS